MNAAELMTADPRTIRSDDPVSEALDALQTMTIRHLPVVDDDNNLIGMLTDRDLGALMRVPMASLDDPARMVIPLSQRPVSDFMSSDVVSVEPDTEMVDIIEILLDQRIGAVPVVDGEGSVIGIVSYVDILRAVSEGGEPPARGRRVAAGRSQSRE